jgi:ribosomal protein S12 methylthiotransferase
VMEAQKVISLRKNEEKIGTELLVLVDRAEGEGFVGRTEQDAPEVDNEVFIQPGQAGQSVQSGDRAAVVAPGHFSTVTIVDAVEYDLFGTPVPGRDQ